MASISTSGGVFSTRYQTNTHHTEQTGLTSQQLADAKVDRFFLELSGDPGSTAATLVSSGLMTFTDTGTVQTNAQVENSYFDDSSSAHMEPMTGAQFSVGDWNSVTDTGVTYDFVVEPKLIGLRFDSYQGVQEGSPIVGYLISMQSTQGAAAYFFFPTTDQDLSQMNMPYPNGQTEPSGYTYSEITHYDSLDNLDWDPQANVTYVAYSDLYDGFPSQFTGTVCYGAGTKLRTIQGEITIEDLSVGDLLWTIDAGYQPIVWIGKRTLTAAELARKPHLRAIRMSAHALGHNQPERDLILSLQHRLCLSSNIVERITGEHQALVSAKDLLDLVGVDVVESDAPITYYHVMTAEHQLIKAHGCLGETLFTGSQALRMIPAESRRELHALFPDMNMGTTTVRPHLRGRALDKVIARHQDHSRDFNH